MSGSSKTKAKLALEAFIVWFILCTVYLLTLANNHTEAEDGLRYLNDIRSGDPSAISFPYHLSYGWLGWLTYHVALAFGYGGGPLLPVQVSLSVFPGALGIAVLWILVRIVGFNRTEATVGCGLLAFSYGYWWYSVEVEVYILSTLLLICSLLFAYRGATQPSWKVFAVLGLTYGLAVLAHITNLLFAAVAIVALLLAKRGLFEPQVMRCALAYTGVGIVVITLPYVTAILAAGLNTPREVYDWLATYAQNDAYGDAWGNWEATTLPKAAIGVGRALVGGNFVFSLDPVRGFAYKVLPAQSLHEELFLVRNFNPVLAVVLLMLVVVVVLTLLVFMLQWLRKPPLNRASRVLAILCLAWLVPYTLFFVWWEPDNVEFWIAPWVPLMILLTLPFSTWGRGARRLLPYTALVLIGALFTINYWGAVWLQQDSENDYWRVRSSWYERNATSSDLVVARDYIFANYLRYFSQGTVIQAEHFFGNHSSTEEALDTLQRRIGGPEVRRVLFSSDVLYPASDRFSRCTAMDECEWAADIRGVVLPNTRVVAVEPLEEVRKLKQR
jgi:hypothetical protein